MVELVVLAKVTQDVQAVKIDPETNEPILRGVPLKVSDFDLNAMEEALRIKAKLGGRVRLLTAGGPEARDQMRRLIAMGADEAILVTDPAVATMDYCSISKLLAAAVRKLGKFDLILCGEASIDLYSGQMGPRVAGALGIPSVSYIKKLTAEKEGVVVEREMGDELEELRLPYPALVTVGKELNEPRLPPMMQLIAASRKPIAEWKAGDLGLSQEELAPAMKTESLRGVVMKRKNVIFSGEPAEAAKSLVAALKKEGIIGGGA
ncbi:MAG: electron transfer flavoprotein subunit beta/FixA family protein [Thermoplasmata archaeon]